VLALLLLAESFGHQVGWLWRTRRVGRLPGLSPAPVAPVPSLAQAAQVTGAARVTGAAQVEGVA
jgi:hypothetical protein